MRSVTGQIFCTGENSSQKEGFLPDLWARDLNVFFLLKPSFCVFCAAVSLHFYWNLNFLTSLFLHQHLQFCCNCPGSGFLVFQSSALCFSSMPSLGDCCVQKKSYCKNKILVRASSNVLCLLSWSQSTFRAPYRFSRNCNTAPHMGDWCSRYELRYAKEKLLFFYDSLTSPVSTKWEKTES